MKLVSAGRRGRRRDSAEAMRKSTSLKRGNFMSAWIVVPPTVRLRMLTSSFGLAVDGVGGAEGARLDDRILAIEEADRRLQLVVAVARDRHAGRRIVEPGEVVVAGLEDQHVQAGAGQHVRRGRAAGAAADDDGVERVEAGVAEDVRRRRRADPCGQLVEAERFGELGGAGELHEDDAQEARHARR